MAYGTYNWRTLRLPVRINPGWIGPSQTTFASVDVSAFVPTGTKAIRVLTLFNASVASALPLLRCLQESGDTDDNGAIKAQAKVATGSVSEITDWEVNLKSDLTFQARFVTAWTSTTNEAYIVAVAGS